VVDPSIRFLVIDAIGSKPGIISLLRAQRRDRMRLAIGGLTLIVQARLTAATLLKLRPTPAEGVTNGDGN
jgi:hypothetical protein